MSIAGDLAEVRARVARAAARTGRSDEDVRIVAVSKTWPAEVVAEALDAGATDLGENRAQELKAKAAVLSGRARWHFVGHLQTNKVRHVVGVAVLVHSVDRIGVAEAIARRASALGISQDVLVEVNVSGEATKQGVEPARAAALVEQVAALEGVRVLGLMTMPPWPEHPEDARPYYRDLAALREDVTRRVPEARELSMGMTRDFEVAIEEGATLVRIGEAIFGARRP
jgi:pyridoxal phosphate enzyme (YggS family)